MKSPASGRNSSPKPSRRYSCARRWRMPHRLAGLSPQMTTRPSGTSTRSTSRSVACGSGLSSSVCGSTTRSRLLAENGSAAKSVTSARCARQRAGRDSASQRCGMRLARRPVDLGQAQLQRVVAEHVGHGLVELGLLPRQQVAAGRGLEPLLQTYNLTAHDPRSAARLRRQLHLDAAGWSQRDRGRPGDAAPVFDALARGNLQLAAILVTHHHADHAPEPRRRTLLTCVARAGTRQRRSDSVHGACKATARRRQPATSAAAAEPHARCRANGKTPSMKFIVAACLAGSLFLAGCASTTGTSSRLPLPRHARCVRPRRGTGLSRRPAHAHHLERHHDRAPSSRWRRPPTCGTASAAASRCPTCDSDLVRDREQWYATPARLHPAHDRALAASYIFHIVEELERRNMPTELALLPYIESAFNPQAVSSAQAPPACGSSCRPPAPTST